MSTTKPKTRLSYGRRIARVQAHVAEHLDAVLDVERLAAIAHFSPWHFHRVYRETAGETVAETVRRLRLHRAAGELLRDDTSLERIARRAGYGSRAAFSRAFAAATGCRRAGIASAAGSARARGIDNRRTSTCTR